MVSTPDGVGDLLSRISDEYRGKWPVLLEVSIAGSTTAEHMYVGVDGDRGVLFYSSPTSGSCYSHGDAARGPAELSYYYAGHAREFPASAEIALKAVVRAVREFLATNGGRPDGVMWQAGSGD
jgi:hypothetical protein